MSYSLPLGINYNCDCSFIQSLLFIQTVIITFYSADEATDDVAWIPNKHYSGVYGLLKLTLPRILPDWLDRVIVLDCDVTLAADVAELWTTFSLFSQKQV